MYLFNIVNVLIEMALLLFYCNSVFEAKKSVSNIVRFFVVLGLVCVSILTGALDLGTVVNLLISYGTFLAVVCCLYNGTIKAKLFIDIIWIVSVIVADILATIMITFFGIEYNMFDGDNITYIVGAMLSDFIRLWILAYVGKILSCRMRDLPVYYWIFLFVCPVLSVICLVIFDIYLMQAETVNRLLVFIPPFCILYINFMLFRFFETFSEQIRLKVVEELAQRKEENYKILQNNEEELRKLRHDMKNHILMLHEYLEHNDSSTAFKHLKNIQETLSEISAVVCTSNPAIDAAINIGARKAQTENINYKVQIVGDVKVNIDAADICKFLSNAIDNALEAACLCENGFVYVELTITEEKVNIHIENNMLTSEKSKFFTSKKDTKNHGFGMKNMKSVVKKYDGFMEYKVKNNIFYLDTEMSNKG